MPNAPDRAAGTPGIDTSRFGHLLGKYQTVNVVGTPVDQKAFEKTVLDFVAAHPYDKWFNAWRANSGTFLQTLCWGFDRRLGPTPQQQIRGAMDDRCFTNLERVVRPQGLDVHRDIEGKDCCVIGCWTGEENLILAALGAKTVDGIEEVPEYGVMANYQMLAFKVRGRVRAQSLFDVSSVDALTPRYDLVYMPGVMYHLTDPICAMLIVQSMLKPGGVFAFETAYAPDASGTLARYLGASVVGWNWWAPGVGCYNAMLHDAGFVQEHQVEQIGGRSWFMGIKGADTPPLVKSGAAGFSRPDILQRLARRP